jgi:hypothetical protein
MTRLRLACLFVAVVSGDYAALRLIDGQLIDWGVAAAICAGSSVAAGLIAYAGRRRREAMGRRRAAVWERRDQQAAAVSQQCPLCGGARQKPSDSPRFVDRQRMTLCVACAPAPNPEPTTVNPRPVSARVSMGEKHERVRRWTAGPASASREFGWGGGASDDPSVEVVT